MSCQILHGDCRQIMPTIPTASVDSIVTDPPYELGFMGKRWDATGIAYDVGMWGECLRVLKPGGHLLAFGGTRTYHRMVCAIEDAGFEIRDSIHWLYGSGFPKSLDVSKAIDKAAGAEREVIASVFRGERSGTSSGIKGTPVPRTDTLTAPATDAARQWEGWGTALKPAHEPIVVARKPLNGTVAANVLQHGTGALNINACRIEYDSQADKDAALRGDAFKRKDIRDNGWSRPWMQDQERIDQVNAEAKRRADAGRWPANVIIDDHIANTNDHWPRYFYIAKPSKAERNTGLDGLPERSVHRYGAGIGEGKDPEAPAIDRNHHPTVKPLTLIRYLIKLVTPPDGTVLDPFAGSGTTLTAAILEHRHTIGIELTDEYHPIIHARTQWATTQINGQLPL
jgi:DNA modification methylase